MANKLDESSFLTIPQNPVYKSLFYLYEWFSAVTDPVSWIIDRRSKTILDVGCGQGYPMKLIKKVRNLRATGMDLFDKYLKEAKRSGIYEEIVKGDVTKLKIKNNSYDTVMSLQVIEHVTKKDGLAMMRRMEEIAKYQVIIATPYHFFEHPDMDGNKLQRHLSHWSDEDFKRRGYVVHHVGLEVFYGNDGFVHQNIPRFVKAGIFIVDKLLTPFYWFVPGFSDYWIIAYKDVSQKK
jgi:SAM-dependent methyltransferase